MKNFLDLIQNKDHLIKLVKSKPYYFVLIVGIIGVLGFFATNIFFSKNAEQIKNVVIANNFKSYQTPTLFFKNVAYAKELEGKTKVIDANGNLVGTNLSVSQGKGGTQVKVSDTHQFTPGKYTILIDQNGKKITQDFTWGVLAINPNKSIYSPNDKADLAIAVLDEKGKMACDAEVTLTIRNPYGFTTTLNTKDKSIIINPECVQKSYTEKPDFQASYQLGGAGVYQMDLTAKTANGTYSITDFMLVDNNLAFDVERTSGTRIFPFSSYPMTATIKANQDFDGVVKELAPSDFKISALENVTKYSEIRSVNGLQEISWKVNVKKGQTVKIGYKYNAPLVSPQFYLLGPLAFYQNNQKVFEESRQWQLAIDDVSYSSTILGTSGLTAYWRMGESSGTTATDIKGGYNGTYTGSPTLGATGLIANDSDTAVSFTGTGQYISVPNNAALSLTTNFSIEMWIHTPTSNTTYILYDKGSSGGQPVIYVSAGILGLYSNSGPQEANQNLGTLASNTDYHIVVTYGSSANSGRIYINGADNTEYPGAGTTFTANLVDATNIGAEAGTTTMGAGGKIDEVAVYNGTVLTPAQVYQHYALGKAFQEPTGSYSRAVLGTQGLLAYWRLGDGSGITAHDAKGNASGFYTNSPTLGVSSLVSSEYNTAASFKRASTQKVDIVNNMPAGGSTGTTVEAWVNFASDVIGDQHGIFSWGPEGTAGYHMLMWRRFDATTWLMYWYFSDGTDRANNYWQFNTTNPIPAGTTHHIVVTHDYAAKKAYLYIDGVSQGSLDFSAFGAPLAPAANLISRIAGYMGNDLNALDGTLDDVAVYGRPLSAAEVAAHYQAGASTLNSNFYSRVISTPGLVSYWRLGESSGSPQDIMGVSNSTSQVNLTYSQTGAIYRDTDTSISFNGTGSSTTFSTNGWPSGTQARSIGAWFKTTSSSQNEILGYGTQTGAQDFAIGLYQGKPTYVDHSVGNFHQFGSSTYNDGNWHYYVLVWNGTTFSAYVDGNLIEANYTPGTTLATATGTTNGHIGVWSGWWNGAIDEVSVYNRALTSVEISTQYKAGVNTSSSSVKSPYYDQAIKGTTGIVAYWPMDEASGGFKDLTGNGHDTSSVIGGPTYQQSGALTNNFGSDKSTKFVRNTDYAVVPHDTAFNVGDGPFSVEFWAKTNATGNTEWMFGKWDSSDNGWAVGKDSTGHLDLYNRNNPSTSMNWNSSTAPVNDNNWHYYVFTKSAGSAPQLYADGVALSVTNTGGASTTIQNNSYPIGISSAGNVVSNNFGGNLEKLAFYKKVLSPGEIAYHYSLATKKYTSNYSQKVMGAPGLVGYWRLGESSGFPKDSSGNGNDATSGTATQGVAGAINADTDTANTFNGSSNAWVVPNNTNYNLGDNFTISLWFKRGGGNGTSQFLLSKGTFGADTTWGVFINTSNKVVLETSLTDAAIITTSTAITDTNWHQVVFTKNGSVSHAYLDGVSNETAGTNVTLTNSTVALHIGNETDNSTNFNGSLDEIALYTGALDATTIQNIYTVGAPSYKSSITKTPGLLGYWRLGDSGTTMVDALNLHNGSYLGTYTQGEAGAIAGDIDTSFRSNGSTGYGKVGNDATNDFPLGSGAYSLELWFKRTATQGVMQFLWSKSVQGNLFFDTDNKLHWDNDAVNLVNTNSAITDTNWHQAVVTHASGATSYHMYIDGQDVTVNVNTGSTSNTTNSFFVGQYRSTGSFFPGNIDEISYYNQELSASQVKAHYYVGKTSGIGTSYDGGLKLNGLIIQ